jgi:lactonase
VRVRPEATLSYTDLTRGLAPIPACEQGIPTATAEPFFKVSDESMALEGPAFDRQGNLVFVDIYGGRVLRLSPDRVLSTIYQEAALQPAGIAVHKDGRIFVAAVGNFTAGRIIALPADGGAPQIIVPASAGHVPNDLVFDSHGGFYFTDFMGTSMAPTGGVYYVSPDFTTIAAVLPNMSAANGVALGPDGKVLWATEYCAGRLHRVDLQDAVTLARSGTAIPYHFVGRGPDSMRADADGNIYVAMNRQGRVLVFGPHGIPIGQILMPGREDGRFLRSTSLAFVPGSREVVIVARDEFGDGGAMIFRAEALTQGATLFSHQ